MEQYSKTCLIGYTGYVGTNLDLKYNFTHKYNSKNIHEIQNDTYDLVICAGISATKWWSNLHEKEDLDNIMSLLNNLKSVKTKKFILISTIDVYNNINDGNEDTLIDPNNMPYGKNRHYVETFIKETFDNYNIIRLPGLFGFGLKKNIIYDYLHNSLKELNINSSFQWYNVGNLFDDINIIIQNNNNITNLFTEPIHNNDLHNIFRKYNPNFTYTFTDKNQINYNVKTKYSICSYQNTKQNILSMIDSYICNMLYQKLTISSLSWKHNNDEDMLNKLSIFGINKLEVSPYKYFGKEIINVNANDLNKKFDIYAFQSLLYPNTFNIFSEPDLVLKHLEQLIKIAGGLGVKVLVFGSPKNRKKNDLSYNSALQLAITFFKKASSIAELYNVILVIEPNAKCYGCDFITNSNEGRELVLGVNSKSFKLHLDFGCMYLENENIIECITNNLDILAHIHISAPNLDSLGIWKDKINYKYLFNTIKKIYNETFSIEMLGQEDLEILRDVMYLVS